MKRANKETWKKQSKNTQDKTKQSKTKWGDGGVMFAQLLWLLHPCKHWFHFKEIRCGSILVCPNFPVPKHILPSLMTSLIYNAYSWWVHNGLWWRQRDCIYRLHLEMDEAPRSDGGNCPTSRNEFGFVSPGPVPKCLGPPREELWAWCQ